MRERRAGVPTCDACRAAVRDYRKAREPYRRARGEFDPVAVERAVSAGAGERVPLSMAERAEAVRRCNARGMTDRRIAVHLGLSERTVVRYRQRHGVPAVEPYRRAVAA
jgi:DNA-binding NarL/FixJ family response regulator